MERWRLARTAIVAGGIPYAAVTLGAACLDYAGEDWEKACGRTSTGSASASGNGTAGSGSVDATYRADCGVAVQPSGSGSGSAEGIAQPTRE